MMNNTLTDIPGILVGHATDTEAATGCTVVLCPQGTVGAVDVRGGAPGTRETDLLKPHNHVQEVNAILLAGGSAFGLAAADGVVRFLEDREIGYQSGAGFTIPIVSAAILFDLMIGSSDVRPGPAMGYAACESASDAPVAQGNVGAGTGAMCGAMLGKDFATKGGLGSASMALGGGLMVAALVAVNAVGDVLDESGQILAGVRQPPTGDHFIGTLNVMRDRAGQSPIANDRENTVIGVIATNAALNKTQAYKVAQMAHDGIARAINPAHTMHDGDTIYALATGTVQTDVSFVGAFAAEVMAQAIRNGVRAAKTLHGVRAYNE